MKLLFIPILLFAVQSASAQSGAQTDYLEAAPDTAYMVVLENFDKVDARTFASNADRYRYNQTKYYVKKLLPLVNAGTATFTEINQKLNQPGISRKERKAFISNKEEELRRNFELQVKKLNETQGILLMKLLARQTGLNIYHILKETKGAFAAMKYQAVARLNGYNLNSTYHPEEEPDLELIMNNLGYPLAVR